MALGVSIANAVDPVLTGIFSEFMNADMSRVGRMAAPLMQVGGMSAQWATLTTDMRLNLDRTDEEEGADHLLPLALDVMSREVGLEFSTDSTALLRYATHICVPDRVERHWNVAHGFSPTDVALRRLAQQALDRHNYHILRDIYSDSTLFGSSADPGNLTTASTAWIDNVNTARNTIVGACGFAPTHAVMNRPTAQWLMLSDQIRQRPAGNSAAGTLADDTALANFFRSFFSLDLLIDDSYYETAANARATIMGDHIAIVRLASDGSPTFCRTWVEDVGIDQATLAGITSERVNDPAGVKLLADIAYAGDVIDAEAGYLLTDVLT